MTVPIWAWIATLAVFAVLIAGNLVLTRGAGTGLRVAAGVAFGGVLWLWQGPAIAGHTSGGYLLEKALSVDSTFVFVLLFGSLAVPVPLHRWRVLLDSIPASSAGHPEPVRGVHFQRLRRARACARSTSCWRARSTGSATSNRASPSCWCSSG